MKKKLKLRQVFVVASAAAAVTIVAAGCSNDPNGGTILQRQSYNSATAQAATIFHLYPPSKPGSCSIGTVDVYGMLTADDNGTINNENDGIVVTLSYNNKDKSVANPLRADAKNGTQVDLTIVSEQVNPCGQEVYNVITSVKKSNAKKVVSIG